MSDNDFNAPRFKKGHSLTAEKLNKLVDGVRSAPMRRNFAGLTRNTPAGQTFVPHATGGSGSGGSLVYATSPNTDLDETYTYGATFDAPDGTGTALEDTAIFKISTPWNTAVTAPVNMFEWWNKIGDTYYKNVVGFFIKCETNYTDTDDGVETFTVYLDRGKNITLGDEDDFPAGIKAIAEDFDADNAGSNSQAFFNNRVLPCKYSPSDNIIYIEYRGF